MSDYEEVNPFENDPLLAIASTGIEVEEFFASRPGRLVIQRAEEEIEACYREFAQVDAEDSKAIRDIQFRIRVARAAPQWLNNAIQSGRNAELQIKLQEENEEISY